MLDTLEAHEMRTLRRGDSRFPLRHGWSSFACKECQRSATGVVFAFGVVLELIAVEVDFA